MTTTNGYIFSLLPCSSIYKYTQNLLNHHKTQAKQTSSTSPTTSLSSSLAFSGEVLLKKLIFSIEILMASSRTALYFSLVLVMFSFSEAKDFLVGGKSDAWAVPSSQSDQPLNQWAQKTRFRVGDSLVWKYEEGKDSVLEVSRESYLSCNLTTPVAEYKDGKTMVRLERSGAYYFISGTKGHCEKGQKLIVVVMSPKHSSISASPASSPMGSEGPAMAPTSNAHGLKGGFMVMMMASALVGVALV